MRHISKTAASRFATKYRITASGCWEWSAAKNHAGYGFFTMYKKQRGHTNSELAHRASWILHRGQIPESRFVCHHCDNPSCVNPDHLFVGSATDNVHDMIDKGRAKLIGRPRVSHCAHGHELTGANLLASRTGKRACRTCYQRRDREAKAVDREANRDAYNAKMRAYRRQRTLEGRTCR